MELLIVEDEDPKREHLLGFVRARLPACVPHCARSVRSALALLREKEFDLVLLDMSLPTFDVGADEPGGRPQGFGGMEVLRYMDRYKIKTPTIVVTAYEAFFSEARKGIDLETLSDELTRKHPNTYRRLIYYNPIFGDWEEKLDKALWQLKEGGRDESDDRR